MTMNHEERGLYILMLCLQWTQGGIKSADLPRLAGAMAQPSVDHVISKFKCGPDRVYRNERLEKVRGLQQEFSKNRSESGKSGAAKRWLGHGTAIQQPMAKNGSPSPSPSPIKPPTPFQGNGEDLNGREKSVFVPTETMLRFGRIFRCRVTKVWDKKELKALREIEPVDEEDFRVIEKYYTAKIPADKDYRRKNLIVLLNNWNGEVDRARNFKVPSIL